MKENRKMSDLTDEQFTGAVYGALAEAGRTDIELGIVSSGDIACRVRQPDGTYRRADGDELDLVIKASMLIDETCIPNKGVCCTPVATIPPPWWS